MSPFKVRDISLAPEGRKKIDWVSRFMPILRRIEEEFKETQPFKGLRIACCLHLEMKTAYLALVLKAGGAKVSIAGSNPLTTKDDVAAALAKEGVMVYSWYGMTREEYYENLNRVLDIKPNILIDDGADLTALIHRERRELIEEILGGSEETTSGVIRLKAMEEDGTLRFPMIAVNDSKCKYMFDNRYGTGQSAFDGIMRATNLLIAGKNVVIAGYGWVGKGLAMRARGLGGNVIVTEVDPIKALEARMDGYRVMTMREAARVGDLFITATGNINVIRKEHFKVMKDGAILANVGYLDTEISKGDLESLAKEIRKPKENVTEYLMPDGRRIYLLADGKLVNLAAADGHPAEIMDMSFALQALSAKYIKDNSGKLEPKVYRLPEEIDRRVAEIKLESMGIQIDELTEEQKAYLKTWMIETWSS